MAYRIDSLQEVSSFFMDMDQVMAWNTVRFGFVDFFQREKCGILLGVKLYFDRRDRSELVCRKCSIVSRFREFSAS